TTSHCRPTSTWHAHSVGISIAKSRSKPRSRATSSARSVGVACCPSSPSRAPTPLRHGTGGSSNRLATGVKIAWRRCLAAVEVDEESLRDRCAIDSTVLFLALEHKPHRSGTPAARALWKALLEHERVNRGARVYIPALVVAELARGAAPAKAPRVAGVH